MYKNSLQILNQLDYQKAFDDLGDFCKNNLSLVLYGQFGNPSFPSISDLDVLICLKDTNFKEERDQILHFISEDSIRGYLFFHDPLIIPESVLPDLTYFHTLYGLDIVYNKINFIPEIPDEGHRQFLNLIWATFLISVSPSFFADKRRSDRDLLLLFKNICQSIDNFSDKSNALNVSFDLRRKYYDGGLNSNELRQRGFDYLGVLLKCLNDVSSINREDVVSKDRYLVSYNKMFRLGSTNDYVLKGKFISIRLNHSLFVLFDALFNGFSRNLFLNRYILRYNNVFNNFSSFGVNNPFVVPFAFQFYRDDLPFKCLKLINRYML